MISDNVLATIGNTPLIRLHRVTAGIAADVLAKVETFNPGHSIKDRMSLEEENRELSRRVIGHDGQSVGGDLGWRLQAIEQRLAHIEALLKARA